MIEYVELHAHSCYSFLDGASQPQELVARAFALGMPALALTDHNGVYGVVPFMKAAREAGIKPIVGTELTFVNDEHLTLLVKDATGWKNLGWLITQAQQQAPKGEAKLLPEQLTGHTDGLIALSGCERSRFSRALRQNDDAAIDAACWLVDSFGRENVYIELQNHLLPADKVRCVRAARIARTIGLPLVATNNVHYAARDRRRLQDVMVCIRNLTTLSGAKRLLRHNSEYFLKSSDEMAVLFADFPEAIASTLEVAERCQLELAPGLQELPIYPAPDGMTPVQFLRQLCEAGLSERKLAASDRALNQLDRELTIIENSGLVNYFLIVWDIVRFANEAGIACQGRGSAANSLVAYLLRISPANPIEHNLVFERFLSEERRSVPDIDIDFDAARREEVIQYIYSRYGREHAAMACTFSTFRARAAARDIGKVLELPPELLEQLSSAIDPFQKYKLSDSVKELSGKEAVGPWLDLVNLCEQIEGLPRHLGLHNGGMVITGPQVWDYVPVEPATMADRSVVQWDKDHLEEMDIIKFDVLGLRMLSAVSEASAQVPGGLLKWDDFADPAVYDLICRADTIGVFQLESRAQQQVLPRLKPRCLNDLIVSISLIRPGPVQGGMVNPYLNRRLGVDEIKYMHPLLEPALEETLGVVLFQEQVLKVAHDLAGFTLGQGELLRRALGSKRAGEAIARLRDEFVIGAITMGVDSDTAEMVFKALEAFGGYSFPKSHAASFAVLVYRSAWLKCYYPAEFAAALLNNQPMGFWSPAVIVKDVQRNGLTVYPVDLRYSGAKCAVENGGIRLGFHYVDGFGEKAIAPLLNARDEKPFTDLRDLAMRSRLPNHLIENLILAGAMDEWGQRRQLIWELGRMERRDGVLDLGYNYTDVSFAPTTAFEEIGHEYAMLGMSLEHHPLEFFTSKLQRLGVTPSEQFRNCPDKTPVRVAGQMLVHQAPPTAKGFHFVTLDDMHGMINVIVRPKIYAQYRHIWRDAPLLVVNGELQHEGDVVNIIASRVSNLQTMKG